MHATRAAVEEGIVAGGGTALLRAQSVIDTLKLEGDERFGAAIVRRALEEPVRVIAQNAGFEGSVIIDKVRNAEQHIGFDAKSGQLVDMVQEGIVDPAKVTRTALQNAASIAGLMITTETIISDLPEDKKEVAPMNPGMGGMGGMGGMY